MTALFDQRLQVIALKQRYNLNNIVETGCWHGDGLTFAKKIGIQNLYSCDINERYVAECRDLLPNATIHHQDSIEFLKEILPGLTGLTLFWLDAHYPVYYGLEEENTLTKFPLVEELKLVRELKSNYQQDVIICDDLRVLAAENNPYYLPSIGDQFMVEHSIKDLTDVLADTHNFYTMQADTGNLIFIPKT
jgi:hypothetical protein